MNLHGSNQTKIYLRMHDMGQQSLHQSNKAKDEHSKLTCMPSNHKPGKINTTDGFRDHTTHRAT